MNARSESKARDSRNSRDSRMSIDERLESIKDLIRHGRVSEAKAAFTAVLDSRYERRHLRWLANIAWRLEMPDRAISLLVRRVRPSGRGIPDADEFERMEYGVALIQSGAWEEGGKLLESVSPEDFPEVLLFRCFYHIHRHEPEATVPLLEELLAHPGLGPNGKLNAKVFLAHSIESTGGDLGRARSLLAEVLTEASPEKYGYHYCNANLVLAQIEIRAGRFDEADLALQELEAHGQGSGSIFCVLSRKWRAIHDLHLAREREEIESAVRKIESVKRELAGTSMEWRGRLCDYYLARCANDENAFLRLYFGTASDRFRARLAAEFAFRLPVSYRMRIGEGPRRGPVPVISAVDGSNSMSRERLGVGQAPQRLFEALCSDFYRGFRLHELHEAVYAGEHFNPTSSPARVQQVIKRLREWFRRAGLPLEVDFSSGVYRLIASSPCEIEIGAPEARRGTGEGLSGEPTARVRGHALKALGHFGIDEFSVREFAELLGISERSAVRHLKDVCKAGLAVRMGRGRATSYRLTPDADLFRRMSDHEKRAGSGEISRRKNQKALRA